MSKLVERARQIRSELDLSKLKERGLRRDRREYEFIVTYPAIAAMSPISQEDVFTGKPGDRTVHFYVHVPFCTGTCTYCGRFQKFPRQPLREVENYVGYLERELDILRAVPDSEDMKIASLYFGGGTPTYLNARLLKQLGGLVSRLNVLEGAEFTVEMSPETVSKVKLEALSEIGVNRVSTGVQSFDNNILRACERRHDAERARKAAEMVRKAGFDNFNIDLILGLPGQTLEGWERDLRAAADCGVSCVTTYPLEVMPGCQIAGLRDSAFPSEEESLLMGIMAKEFFSDLGFREDPVHFFASSERATQGQNIRKWEGEEWLGLGVSTYQFLNDVQFHNHFDRERYMAVIDSGRLPIWIGAKLDRNEQMARIMVLGMKRGKVNERSFEEKFGEKPEDVFPEIKRLVNLSLVEVSDDEIKLTYSGSLFSEEVATCFFTDETRQAYERRGSRYGGHFLAGLPDY